MSSWKMQSSDGGSLKLSSHINESHTVIFGDMLNVTVSYYAIAAHFKNNTQLFSWS